jgi:hypothetical protein
MKPRTLTIHTPHGTVTRTTARTYTHVVTRAGLTLLEELAVLHERVCRTEQHLADTATEPRVLMMHLANGERQLKQIEALQARIATTGPFHRDPIICGWCGRLELALRLAARVPGSIISPVNPEYWPDRADGGETEGRVNE